MLCLEKFHGQEVFILLFATKVKKPLRPSMRQIEMNENLWDKAIGKYNRFITS